MIKDIFSKYTTKKFNLSLSRFSYVTLKNVFEKNKSILDDSILSKINSSTSKINIVLNNTFDFNTNNISYDVDSKNNSVLSYINKCNEDLNFEITSDTNNLINFSLNTDSTRILDHIYNLHNELLNNYLLQINNIYQDISSIDKKIIENYVNNFNISKSINYEIKNDGFMNINSVNYYLNYLTHFMNRKYNLYSTVIVNKYNFPFENDENKETIEDKIELYNKFYKSMSNNLSIQRILVFGSSIISKDKLFNKCVESDVIYSSKTLSNSNLAQDKALINVELNKLNMILANNDRNYIDTIKTLVHLKKQCENKIPLDKGIYYKKGLNIDINDIVKKGINVINYDFESFISENISNNRIKINDDNSISVNSTAIDYFNSLLFSNEEYINNLSYKNQLAYYYYYYLMEENINAYLKSISNIFNLLSINAKTNKEFEKFPNFSFRNETELGDYLEDVFSLDLISNHGKDSHINFYDMEDQDISLSETLKNFSLITYDELEFAILIKGNKYKKTVDKQEINVEDESSNYIKSVKESNKKKPFEKATEGNSSSDLMIKALKKLNENKLHSVSKHEAVNIVLSANKDIKRIYIISVSNYMKFIESNSILCNVNEY